MSTFDLPDAQQLLVHACEDCACPVTSNRLDASPSSLASEATTDTTHWVRGREVVELPLDSEHHLLFNPLGRGGVVVVNELAHRIFRRFQQPSTVGDAQRAWAGPGDEFVEVSRRLGHLEIIHPSGQVQRPTFHTGTTLTACST